MKKFFFFVMMVAVMALPAVSWGKTMQQVEGVCPDGHTMTSQVECEPGQRIIAEMVCPTGVANFSVNCPPEPETASVEQKPVRAYLLLDVSLTGGAFGLGSKPVTGGTMLNFGLELRPHKVVGVEFEGRFGITGNFWDCQKTKASLLVGAGLLLTVNPHQKVRLGFGIEYMTVRDSSWITIVDGFTAVARLDYLFYRDVLGLRVQFEVGPGWDVAHQLHTWWGASAGLVFTPAVLKK